MIPTLLDFKFRPPELRPDHVRRDELLDRVGEMVEIPNLAILAPAGYGKTTLMSQLEARDQRRTAWLTLDDSDNEPAALLRSLARSLEMAGFLDEAAVERITAGRSVLTQGVNDLWSALDASSAGALFLDQIDHVTTQSSRDIVAAVMARHPGNIQVVVASRSGDGLPLPLLGSRAEIAELAVTDLAMTADEAEDVFRAMDVDIAENLPQVMRRTEGWPVAIYLTALALKNGVFAPDALEVRGDDILFADYIRQELLAHTPDEVKTFLMRTSILEQLSGHLCDYVLDRAHSAEMLTRLEKANHLIVPLDRTRTWYRYHSLLRDLMRSELERHHHDEIPALHVRAADWFEKNGLENLAIDHAMAAGDTARFGDLAMASARRVYAQGQVETLSRWWSWMEDTGGFADLPELAAMAGYWSALDGDVSGSERLAAHALTNGSGTPVPDDELGPFALLLRSYQAASGADQALADSREARDAFGAESDWIHICIGAEAMAMRAIDGLQGADSLYVTALSIARALGALPAVSYALAQRALAAIDRNEWEAAGEFGGESLETIKLGRLEGYFASALTFTLATRIEARKGNVDAAQSFLARAAASRPRLTTALPLYSVQILHEMARAYLEIADVAGARRVMREAADIIAIRPRLGRHIAEHDALKEGLSDLSAGTVGASSLTSAELRLLPMLVTHLTFPEIGERLYVSRHTVKAHAQSIYRKLGVSSRSEAVSKARQIGLISL